MIIPDATGNAKGKLREGTPETGETPMSGGIRQQAQ